MGRDIRSKDNRKSLQRKKRSVEEDDLQGRAKRARVDEGEEPVISGAFSLESAGAATEEIGSTKPEVVEGIKPELVGPNGPREGRQSGNIRVTGESYSLDGVMRGRLGKAGGPRVGVVSQSGCLSWAWTAQRLGWDVAWVMIGNSDLGTLNRAAYRGTFSFLDWSVTDWTDVPGVAGLLSDSGLSNPSTVPAGVEFMYWPRTRGRQPTVKGWTTDVVQWDHALLGGVTARTGGVFVAHRNDFAGSTYTLPGQPRRRLSSILKTAVGGRTLSVPPDASWPPRVDVLRPGGVEAVPQ